MQSDGFFQKVSKLENNKDANSIVLSLYNRKILKEMLYSAKRKKLILFLIKLIIPSYTILVELVLICAEILYKRYE